MNHLLEAGLEVQQFMKARGWQFCFIGGIAVIRWGEPRLTQDVDISLFTDLGNEKKYINEILNYFKPRISDALDFALSNRVLLFYASNGVSIDLALSILPYEQKMIERASPFSYAPDCCLNTCSAEDLVILKAVASRPKDWIDIEGIIIRQKGYLDRDYIIKNLNPFCEVKEDARMLVKLRNILNKY